MRDPRPARIPFPVALFPVPALLQPLVFQGGYPRIQLPPIDRRVTESAERYQSVLDGKTTSGRRSVYFRFRSIQDGALGDIEVGQLVGARKPPESIYGARI